MKNINQESRSKQKKQKCKKGKKKKKERKKTKDKKWTNKIGEKRRVKKGKRR